MSKSNRKYISNWRAGYYDYPGKRSHWMDGYWWGVSMIYGIKIDESRRLQKYPSFYSLDEIELFADGYNVAVDDHRTRFNIDVGEATWKDYEECKERFHQLAHLRYGFKER
jgi:hypothetical protein